MAMVIHSQHFHLPISHTVFRSTQNQGLEPGGMEECISLTVVPLKTAFRLGFINTLYDR